RAEHGHHGVADELLDRAAALLDLLAQPRVVRHEDRAHVLRVAALGHRRRADEIGEQDRDDLPLLASRHGGSVNAALPERMFGSYARRMSPLDVFRPETKAWFERNFAAPTPAQEKGWPAIASGKSVLIQAPTGSGKTLAAFLSAIDRLTPEPNAG